MESYDKLESSTGFGNKCFEKYSAIKELYDLIDLKLPLTPQEHLNWQNLTTVYLTKVYKGEISDNFLRLYNLRLCKKCGQAVPISNFYRHMAVCKQCYNRHRYQKLKNKASKRTATN